MKHHSLFSSSLFAGLFSLALLSGCASNDDEMNAFVGQPSSELLARLGPPKLRVPVDQGGQIWTYVDEAQPMIAGVQPHPAAFGGSPAGTTVPVSSGFTSRREFFIDAGGTIYKYRGKGR